MRTKRDESPRQAGVRALSTRSRSIRELKTLLLRKGYDEDQVSQAISEFLEAGYLDDRALAARTAESLTEKGSTGHYGVMRAIMDRGIDPDLAEAAADEAFAQIDEVEIAIRWASRRLTGESADAKERERAMRRTAQALERRGFANSTIAAVLDKLFQDRGPEHGDIY